MLNAAVLDLHALQLGVLSVYPVRAQILHIHPFQSKGKPSGSVFVHYLEELDVVVVLLLRLEGFRFDLVVRVEENAEGALVSVHCRFAVLTESKTVFYLRGYI